MNLWRHVRRLKRKLEVAAFIDYGRDHRSTVFVQGTGRSGTTWLSEIINYRNEYRYIFEPFHAHKVDLAHFNYRQYIRPENRDGRFVGPVEAILSGQARGEWMDQFNARLISNKRLVKSIRASLLLKWLHVNFHIPIVLLLRHPCAVAVSKMKLKWEVPLDAFLEQEELKEDFLAPFLDDIVRAETVFERHIFLWCIENYVPLRQFERDAIHLMFYENLCTDPLREIEVLFRFLGKRFDERVLLKFRRPSCQVRADSAVVTGDSLTEVWKRHVTTEEVRRAIDILSLFGLDGVYSQDSMPNVNGAYALMRPVSASGGESY
jgi:hypothetical protein